MASTPVDPRVLAKMLESLDHFGNASSQTHAFGWKAAELIDKARSQVAAAINSDPREIVWTSGATEANNLAIKGAASFYQRKGKHIVTMKTEHASVLKTCEYLQKNGFEITYLPPNRDGLLELNLFEDAMRPDTVLASIMWVNNETGVIQNIEEMAKITRRKGIVFHVDAAQAVGKLEIDVQKSSIDLLSLSAHKVYGPKGAGALYIRRNPRVRLETLIHGGEQEQGVRSGTLPTHQIVGMGQAFELLCLQLKEDLDHAKALNNRFWQGLQAIPEMELNGSLTARVPHCFNVIFDKIDAESLLLSLNHLALSRSSACHSAHNTPSHVLLAMGIPAFKAQNALRFSFGRFTQISDIEFAVVHIQEQVQQLRQLSPNL